jgi:hypothetical protein
MYLWLVQIIIRKFKTNDYYTFILFRKAHELGILRAWHRAEWFDPGGITDRKYSVMRKCIILTVLCNISFVNLRRPDHYGRAIKGLCLRQLACWDCGFKSRRGNGYLSLVSGLGCQLEVSATGLSLVQRNPECVSLNVIMSNNNCLRLQ